MGLIAVELMLAACATGFAILVLRTGSRQDLSAAGGVARATVREWNADPPSHRWALAGVLAVAIIVRLVNLGRPMRYDEAWSFLHYSARPLSVAISDYTLPNNHLLNTLMVSLTTRVLGSAPWVVRLPALIAGLLIVPATYAAARNLAGRSAALFAAALVATLPSMVIYSTNGRGYTMVCLASLLLLLLADVLANEDAPVFAVSFAVVAAVGMWAIPVMLYPAGGIGLWAIIERARRRGRQSAARLARTLAAAAVLAAMLTAIEYAPVIMRHGITPLVANRFVAGLTWSEFVAGLPKFAGSLPDALAQGFPATVQWLLLGAMILSFWSPGLDRRRAATLITTVLAWSLLVLVATRHPPPARVWLFLAPILCLYAGAGLSYLTESGSRMLRQEPNVSMAMAGVLIACGFSLFSIVRHPEYDSFETDSLRDGVEVAAYLQMAASSSDRVVAASLTGPSLDYELFRCCKRRLSEMGSPSRTGRLLLVLDEQRPQALERLKAYWSQILWQDYGTPTLLQKFSATSIYSVEPRRTDGPR